MKILVFSDSHGDTLKMDFALKSHGASVNMVIFLGDGVSDAEIIRRKYPDIPFVITEGNRESPFHESPLVFEEFGLKFFCIHGHGYGVKRGIDRAEKAAAETGADILLYGHTHTPENRTAVYNDGSRLLIFNPGSIGSGYHPSYGVICIPQKGVYVASHAIM